MLIRVILWGILLTGCCLPALSDQQAFSTQTWDTESGLPQNTVQSIIQTRDGYLWLGTEGGLARFDSQHFTLFSTKESPQMRSNEIRALLEDEQGALWIGTTDGVIRMLHHQFHSFTAAAGLPSNFITGLYQDKNRRVCASTMSGNACLVQDRFVAASPSDKPRQALNENNLKQYVASTVLCSYKDREGNIWIGTESTGVTVLRKRDFRAFSDRAIGLDDQVRCILSDRAGVLWFGTNSHGLVRYSNGMFSRMTTADGLSSNVIVSLGQDAQGNLLIGTPDGLNRLHNRKISVLTSADGLPDDFIRSIYGDSDGTVWLGTRHGLARLRNDAFQTFTHTDGLGSDLIGSITRDRMGNLWIATLGGLTRLNNGEAFKNFTKADGLSSNVITALYAAANGSLWIGTQDAGLNVLTNNAIHHISGPSLPKVIHGITQDRQDRLWLASDVGVLRMQDSEAIAYGVSDGLPVNECSGGGHPVVAQAPDGGLWFATVRGVALLPPSLKFDNLPPPLAVDSITVDQQTSSDATSLDIGPGPNRVIIHYSALSFSAPQKVEFRYRLEGFDKNWLEAGHERTAFYTNLGPGHYTFHVIARNGDGVWNNQGATVRMHIQPHFYQTWWFAVLMVLPLTAISYGVYRWRVTRVEAAMESRFEAVLGERNRIAREIHDTLAQGFAGISVQLEIVSRKLGASTESAREHLDQARMLVRSSLAEARRSIWELRSQSDEMADLASRLSKMALQMGGSNQPRIAVQVRGSYRPLPSAKEDELLRIAQEAVTNAIRHAQASQIDVELAFDPKLLRMTIADDGTGFSPTGNTTGLNGHFGLQGIRERAKAIDAKLNLDTAPGAGTRLSIEVVV